MLPRSATLEDRIAAAALNLVIGMLPLSIPNIILAYGRADASWTKSDVFLGPITIGLALIQLVFVYRLQGSPGAAFVGLRVQYPGGISPTLKTTLLRATPYMIAVASSVLMPREVENKMLVGVLALVLLAVAVYIFASGIIALVTGGHSLTDRITGTEVVKAFPFDPGFWRHNSRHSGDDSKTSGLDH